ncbi:hypothetical protein M7I_3838 [Glarea lozoyensis 74030]|uniref:Uncharacterized protein n=1 Tax=Glarea lozoyensis (strain ATCC 74030 / MF5533) TaxID=1104152 RepID=H0EMK0_GLAL7|nr:hypothetical protein M7I_3838 [Glarea lozoyensis 74030]
MWNFPEQTWLIWNPKKLDKARADLWQGVHFILKALYFIKRSFSSRDIVRWAPDKFTKLVYSTDEWDAKLKLNLSLFHSQVLQRSLTYTILKRWRTFPSYPTRLDDRKGKVNVEVVRNRRKIWFRERSDLDREAFYCFTYFTSESVDWEQVYKRETTKDQRIYDWIISSMASAASIIFELGIDDQAEEDVKKSRRGKTERNEQWSNLAGEEAPPCEDLPLREIFGLGGVHKKAGSALADNVSEPEYPKRPDLKAESSKSSQEDMASMEFLTRMQVPEDDVITMGKHTWPSGNGQPEMEFDGRTLLQLDREHVLDDKTILLEEPGRMWDVIRQAQNWAWRNDEVLERRAGEVGSVSGRPIEVVEDDDPVIFKTGRNGRGKRPVYEFRDDEGVVDLSDKGVVELSDDGQEGVVDLSDIEDEEGDANSPIVVDDKPQRRSERDSGHDITDLTVSSSDEMDDLYDA